MGDVKKKWNVTYTKHLTQKRKVYHDGFLELQSSNNKAMLYDDYEKLLGVKILKSDTDVKTGETLAFDSYLVDIGDPHGDYKPIPILNTKRMNKNVPEESGLLHSGKKSVTADNRKSNPGKRKGLPSPLSPSQRIIREFKKNEVHKYSSSPSSLDMANSSIEEWQVLYSTQMTQKAKKFHDGFLQLVMSTSHCKQIMLYDATRRLLDSRFLRKSESIMPGISVTFDGHLVEIGECKEDKKPPKDISPQGKHSKELGERGPIHGDVAVHNKVPAEWDVMYTTQITQRAKKYSNGILRLSSCGSYQSQVTLLTEDGIILCRRFLKLSEHVTTGTTLHLPNYWVDVGGIRTSPEGKPQNDASSRENAHSEAEVSGPDNIKLRKPQSGASSLVHVDSKTASIINNASCRIFKSNSICAGEPQIGACSLEHVESNTASVNNSTSCRISKTNFVRAGETQIGACSLEHMESKTASINNTTSCRISKTNSVRAAHEILSILKKPFTSKGAATVRDNTHADECQLLQSSSLVGSAMKSQTEEHLTQDFNAEGSSSKHMEETIMTHSNDRNISDTDAFRLDGLSQPLDCADQRVSHTHSLGLSTGLAATDIWLGDIECALTQRRSPTTKEKHLAIPESDSKVQPCHDRSNKIPEIEKASESVSHQDNPSVSVPALTDVCSLTHASNKPSVDQKQTDTQSQEGFSGVISDVSNDSAPQFPCHSTKIKSEHEASKMDYFPSFDLGFD
ncbi:hypothetical protein P3L10_000103 [Capsicum annuum]|uniref:uncharacterized protein LOC107864020 n=1 Tax=Capsicum annuum TaxID=4072 RepID=UPI001FB07239|nr:uncharacterized protein LOC107864020 [Capsicum annuum]